MLRTTLVSLVTLATTLVLTGTSQAAVDLTDPHKKDIAMQLVSSAENSTLDWKAQYGYIEDIGDGRGYTAGHHRLLLRHRRHARRWSRPTPTASPATSWPSTCPRCARSTAPTRTRARPGLHQGLEDRRQGHRRSRRRRTTSATASTSTRRSARPRPTGCGRWASSSTTTRSSCTARATTSVSFGGIRQDRDGQGQDPGAGRQRDRPTSTRSWTPARPR